MTDEAVESATEALLWSFGWLAVLVGDRPGETWNRDRLADHDGHPGLHLRPGALDGGIRSWVTVEVMTADPDVIRPVTTLAYQGSMVVSDGPDDGLIRWLGGDGAPFGWAPFRLHPGSYEVTVQVTGREESALQADAHLDDDDAAEPEPVEHLWVTFGRSPGGAGMG